MTRFRMTPKKLAALVAGRSASPPVTWAELARRVGYPGGPRALAVCCRTYPQVPRRARGCVPVEALKGLLAAGATGRAAAAALGVSPAAVRYQARLLGLPLRGNDAAARARRARRQYRLAAARRRRNLAEVRGDVWRARAARLGWPQAGSLLEARILEALRLRGPLTAAGVGLALSQRLTRTGRCNRRTDRAILDLVARGLAARAGRSRDEAGRLRHAYALGPAARYRILSTA